MPISCKHSAFEERQKQSIEEVESMDSWYWRWWRSGWFKWWIYDSEKNVYSAFEGDALTNKAITHEGKNTD